MGKLNLALCFFPNYQNAQKWCALQSDQKLPKNNCRTTVTKVEWNIQLVGFDLKRFYLKPNSFPCLLLPIHISVYISSAQELIAKKY